MANRYSPYPLTSPSSLRLWLGAKSEVHPSKQDQENADAFHVSPRSLAVFDGVSGVREEGLVPAAMSTEMAVSVGNELEYRLQQNAQRYDRQTQLYLKSSVSVNRQGGWLRNLVAKCFATTNAQGCRSIFK